MYVFGHTFDSSFFRFKQVRWTPHMLTQNALLWGGDILIFCLWVRGDILIFCLWGRGYSYILFVGRGIFYALFVSLTMVLCSNHLQLVRHCETQHSYLFHMSDHLKTCLCTHEIKCFYGKTLKTALQKVLLLLKSYIVLSCFLCLPRVSPIS